MQGIPSMKYTQLRAAVPSGLMFCLGLLVPSYLFAEVYKDSKTAVEIVEIPAVGESPTNLYYHFSNFTADNRNIIYADGNQIYRYEITSRTVHAVTSGPGVSAGTACPHPSNAQLLYYLRGPVVFEINIVSGQERRVGEIPEPRQGGYQQPTLTPDLKSLTLTKQRDDANWEIGLMDISTGEYKTVTRQGFRIGHVQHHPREPWIFYVWETGGYAPQRTWIVNDDGSANRPFYYVTDPKQWSTPLKEWVTHESWVAQTGDMTLIVDKVGIVIADRSGKGRLLPGDYWHVSARPDGKFLVADDNRGNLWLIEGATDNRRLLATGLREKVRSVHAHASFDRTGRYVLFNTGNRRQALAWIDLASAGLFVAQ